MESPISPSKKRQKEAAEVPKEETVAVVEDAKTGPKRGSLTYFLTYFRLKAAFDDKFLRLRAFSVVILRMMLHGTFIAIYYKSKAYDVSPLMSLTPLKLR